MISRIRNKIMTSPLVKYLRTRDIEAEAECLLARYKEVVRPRSIIPLEIDLMTEQVLELNYYVDDLQRIYGLPDILGALMIESKQIMIDESLCRNKGRFNFTCAHEIGHWQLHRQYLMRNQSQLGLFESRKKPSIICRSSNARERIEIQADHFAGALLMPSDSIIRDFQTLLAHLGVDARNPAYKETLRKSPTLLHDAIGKTAHLYNTSKEATKVRLQVLHLLPDSNVSIF